MNKILLFFIFMFGRTLLYSQNIVVDGVIFSADGKTLIKYPDDKIGEEYTVPEGTEVIGENAFYFNYSLRNLVLPLSLNRIEDNAFENSDLYSITWKNFPKDIARYAFAGSSMFMFYSMEDSQNCTSMDGVLFSKDKKKLLCFPTRRGDSGIYNVPEGTEIIGFRAFAETETHAGVILPSSLKLIEDEAFALAAFIPTNRNDTRHYGYYWILNVTCNALIPPTIVGDPFINHYEVNLFVPEKSFDIYRNTPYWQDFRSINGDTGINTNQVGNSFSKVWIQSGILYLKSDKEVEMVNVYDANGRGIWSECINNKAWQLVAPKLSRGLLLVKVTIIDGRQETFKLFF
ncbi:MULTISPECIES: leucine-rich repeat protein [Bacteroides]|uniref:leucine-rich repeat protein n=1 Tax=Bacteroides TaxID=816 RepID=UPI00189DD18E|nr:leucine-rich repeat protein [Bacteroides nordii]